MRSSLRAKRSRKLGEPRVPKKKSSQPVASGPPVLRVSVRELVEFVCRTGPLSRETGFVAPRRALEGANAHRRLQKSRPADYEPEVFVTRDIPRDSFVLRVCGRIDGLTRALDQWRLEEIKTLARPHDGEADPLHWAQAKIYAAILGATETRPPSAFELQLTYVELPAGKISEHRQSFPSVELEAFFQSVTAEYLEWAEGQAAWIKERNASIGALPFPFDHYRPGQRDLAVAVYRTIRDGGQLFAEAPTGTGKTMGVLFPAIKALGEERARKIFYLTARTSGRAIAQEAIATLRAKGLRLRAITLTARDKICFNNGARCDVASCQFATSYYDRIKPALKQALAEDALEREGLEALARRFEVCPFELSLDAARWADVIVCDYNYAFDPGSYLRRFFDDDPGGYIFLVDEAHNLPDRAREMFSAAISTEGLAGEAADLKEAIERLAGPKEQARNDVPGDVVAAAETFVAAAEARLVQNQPGPEHDELLERYFAVSRFLRVAEEFDASYATIVSPLHNAAAIRLYCADPSTRLKETLKRSDSTILFSATLSPADYFREAIGANEKARFLRLGSPFPPENLSLLVHRNIETTLRARSQSASAVAEAIHAATSQRVGNYLVFFPSYQYLRDVLDHLRPLTDARLLVQEAGMSEREREAFLKAFGKDPARAQIGFAVLGGVFGEGIDLVGDRLIGVVVVGVGLPQLSLERDLIADRFNAKQLIGYDYAYRFPGFNRVLQAAGRVIRSDSDRGFVLLVDRRFNESRYRQLFPPHWATAQWLKTSDAIGGTVAAFWNLHQRGDAQKS